MKDNICRKNGDYVVIIGGANVDILGLPFEDLVMHDSAPGVLKYTSGGVGRNITENLLRLGANVKFITAFGNDASGDKLKKELIDLGADLSLSLTVDDENTSTYICLNDSKGEMQVALSDMRILSHLTREFFADKFDVINGAKCVVLDTNLGDILGFLTENITTKVFLDTVSYKKARNCKEYVKNLFFVKPNIVEAAALTGEDVSTEKDVEVAADKLLAIGNENVVISMGEHGVYYANGREKGWLKNEDFELVSATGAGDAFMAGTIFGYLNDKSFVDCVKLGLLASKIALTSIDTVSKQIDKLKEYI